MKDMKNFIQNIVVVLFFTTQVCSQNMPLEHYESALLKDNIYPDGVSAVDWFPDDWEVQGVTNDGSNWYFTLVGDKEEDQTRSMLWKIPKAVPLNGNVSGYPGVMHIYFNPNPSSPTYGDLDALDAWHWGDPDHINYNGADYILVPVNLSSPIVICFRAADLAFINYAYFDDHISPEGGGWCAIGSDNDIYASPDDPTYISRYDVDWGALINTQNHNVLSHITDISLFRADGTSLYMTDVQGGEFSSTGEMLYMVSGRGGCLNGWPWNLDGADWTPNDGIHAINTINWRQIALSTKDWVLTSNFVYNYDPTCVGTCGWVPFTTGNGTDTPEGLTFWDIEDSGNSNINGSLHVLVDRYLYGGTDCDDRIYFHHFTNRLCVDPTSNSNAGLQGTTTNPFNTFNQAYNYYPVWDGANIILKSGHYNETGFYNRRIKISSKDGPAIIGMP